MRGSVVNPVRAKAAAAEADEVAAVVAGVVAAADAAAPAVGIAAAVRRIGHRTTIVAT